VVGAAEYRQGPQVAEINDPNLGRICRMPPQEDHHNEAETIKRRPRRSSYLAKQLLREDHVILHRADLEPQKVIQVVYEDADDKKKKIISTPEGFIPPRPRSHQVDPNFRRLPSIQVLK